MKGGIPTDRIRAICAAAALALLLGGRSTTAQHLSGNVRESRRADLFPVPGCHKEKSDTAVQTHGAFPPVFSRSDHKSPKTPGPARKAPGDVEAEPTQTATR